MSEYDLVSRRLAKLAGTAFLEWLLRDFSLWVRFLRWLDARHIAFPGHPDRTSDTIAEWEQLREPAALWAFILEFQTDPDPDMFGRLLIYLGTFWLSERPDPLRGSRYNLAASVVNLTGTQGSTPASRDMVLPGPDGLRCCLQVRERWLQEEPAEPLLDAIRQGQQSRWLLPLLPLHQTEQPEEVIRQWLGLFQGEPDDSLRSEWLGLTLVFAELSRHREPWQRSLEGLNVRRSPFLEQIRNEGRVEGRAEERAEALVQALQVKFPGQVTPELVQRIEQTRDVALLRQWFAAGLAAGSLEEFQNNTLSLN